MKKFIIMILAVLYIGTATGATVNIHYCMGEFAGWEFGHSDDSECSSCGMDKSQTDDDDDCCKDERKVIKLNDAHKNVQSFIDFVNTSVAEQITYGPHVPLIPKVATISFPRANGPPDFYKTRTFLFIRSIRI